MAGICPVSFGEMGFAIMRICDCAPDDVSTTLNIMPDGRRYHKISP